MDLDEKKVAVITGGASGIGLATARVLAGSGVKLVLGDIEEEPLKNALEELHAMGASAIGVRTDVANEEDVIALRDAALREYGGAHVVFNNAGVVGGPCIATPKKVWDWVFSINIDGVVNGINAFVPLFLEQTRATSSIPPRWRDSEGCRAWGRTVRASSPSWVFRRVSSTSSR
jgi:NAD(P)-dependent dehydrogenase (short-subunit alcohol dehydrogenase family)